MNPFAHCSSGCTVLFAVLGQIISMLGMIAGILCLSFGLANLYPYLADFGSYTESVCTITAFKAVRFNDFLFTGVAAVTLTSQGSVQFAAVAQSQPSMYAESVFETLTTSNASDAVTKSFGTLQIGDAVPCGIPPSPLTPALYADVTADASSVANLVALRFNKAVALAKQTEKTALVISGIVLIAVAIACIPVTVCAYGCCDDCCDDCCEDCECCKCCEDCDCSCESCADRVEEWKLERQIKTSAATSPRARGRASAANVDFDAQGNLTHYTCAHGVGPWCTFFCHQLSGKSGDAAAPPAAPSPQQMEKGLKHEMHLEAERDLDVSLEPKRPGTPTDSEPDKDVKVAKKADSASGSDGGSAETSEDAPPKKPEEEKKAAIEEKKAAVIIEPKVSLSDDSDSESEKPKVAPAAEPDKKPADDTDSESEKPAADKPPAAEPDKKPADESESDEPAKKPAPVDEKKKDKDPLKDDASGDNSL